MEKNNLKFRRIILSLLPESKKLLQKQEVSYLKNLGIGIGDGTLIYTSEVNFGSEPYLIKIGNKCIIDKDVRFITHDGAIRVFNFREEYSHIDNKYGKIEIQDNCFIGENVMLMPNVIIGPNTFVAPGAVVYRNLPPNSYVEGNPARVKNKVENFKELYNEVYSKYIK